VAAHRSGSDRRRYPRFVIGGRAKGRVTSVYEASLLDISLGGVLIEHAQIVRPGTLSYLILRLKGREMSLRCRVIRSMVHRLEAASAGERLLIYQTGLEFVEPSGETQQLLSDYIASTTETLYPPVIGP